MIKLRNVLKGALFELVSMRLYWPYLLIINILLPFSYFMIVLLSAYNSPGVLQRTLIGFLVISSFSILIYTIAHRIGNLFEDDILELAASLPITFHELILSYILSYVLYSLPITLILIITLAITTSIPRPLLMMAGLLFMYTIDILSGVIIGLLVRNIRKLDPLLQVLVFLAVILTPAFYEIPSDIYIILLMNPLTHVIVLLKASINIVTTIPLTLSLIYLMILVSLSVIFVLLYFGKKPLFTIIEKK
ncbi:MAG: hypothetical protein ACP5JF_03630 [Candidatus Methanodesulfokora sp.]|jgi:ABC-type polysaccharide/polyol phosphate export permease